VARAYGTRITYSTSVATMALYQNAPAGVESSASVLAFSAAAVSLTKLRPESDGV
jgi:hypothetical protein